MKNFNPTSLKFIVHFLFILAISFAIFFAIDFYLSHSQGEVPPGSTYTADRE